MGFDGIAIGVAEFPDLAYVPILDGLKAYNRPYLGDVERVRLVVEAKDGSGEVIGGAVGNLMLGWLNVELLWVAEEWRGKGLGSAVLAKIEEVGKDRGANRVMLDTFHFQAPEFYKRLGYVEYGRIKEFVPGHDRYYLEKSLA